MKSYLVIDCSNLLHRTFFAGWKATPNDDDMAGMALHSAFTTFNKYYRKFTPSRTILTFDRPNWRINYTTSSMCLSGRIYKANRRQNMTPTEKRRYDLFKEHVNEFEKVVREYTSMVCLAAPMLEADDLIAGFCQLHPHDQITIISADKDLMQLLDNDNVRLIDPITDKDRTCEDIDWFMFLKCIRGDTGDNVQSAFPRVRETRVREAFEDEFERLNLMNEVWTNQNDKELRVGDLYDENRLLMDLSDQPEPIRELMVKVIEHGMENTGKFNYFHFQKFCGKHQLKRISKGLDNYINMLSS